MPKRKVNVLHLASFAGNIGDVANHQGTRRLFAEQLSVDLAYTELEIREFYWKQRFFDDDFIHYANSFDLLLIGGGNYFELWVEGSRSGTSIDLSVEQLERLRVPVIFHALGVDLGQGCSEENARRFNEFIQYVLAHERMFVSVRNDGSSAALARVAGDSVAAAVPVMPDGGFFAFDAQPRRARHASIAVNVAGDMLDRRFDKGMDVDRFLDGVAASFSAMLDARGDLRIDLVPHIWRDVSLIAALLPRIPDPYLRRRVRVAALQPTSEGIQEFGKLYGGADAVLGMRFHANVCPIGMGVPTLGLLTYPQVELLYEELALQGRLIDVRRPGFSDALVDAVSHDFANATQARETMEQVARGLHMQAREVLARLDGWLSGVLSVA